MLLDVFSSVVDFINRTGGTLGLGWTAVIGLSILLLIIIITFIRTQYSIEIKTARAIEKVNIYLEANPFITEENLVEFNKLMKKIPEPMRAQWQKYMVNRNQKPSDFLNEANCIEKPFKTSVYGRVISQSFAFSGCISILAFILNLGYYSSNNASSFVNILMGSAFLPLVIMLLAIIYVQFLKSRRNAVVSDLYFNYENFKRYIDRAVTTLPEYIDYEILFTRKEIVSGIPALQEYLQQRALYEQEQIKKAKNSQVEHVQYDFSKLGTDGAVVMEKAMRECEFYLGNRKRILAEIAEVEGAVILLEKSFDEKSKTNQRKLRDIQETLDRLKEKLDNTTNVIVGNDLREQRKNEIQKQRVLEKEIEDETNKYDQDRKKLQNQIDEKKQEIESSRAMAEGTLNKEFKSYADKIYTDLKFEADKNVKENIENLESEKQSLLNLLEERDKYIVEKNTLFDEKVSQLEKTSSELIDAQYTLSQLDKSKVDISTEIENQNKIIREKDEEIFEIKKELESRKLELDKKAEALKQKEEQYSALRKKKEVIRYFDTNGNEFFVNEKGEAYYPEANYVQTDEIEEPSKASDEQETEEISMHDMSEFDSEEPDTQTEVYEENTTDEEESAKELEVDLSDEDLIVKTPTEKDLEIWENTNLEEEVQKAEESVPEEIDISPRNEAEDPNAIFNNETSEDEIKDIELKIQQESEQLNQTHEKLTNTLEETVQIADDNLKVESTEKAKPSVAKKPKAKTNAKKKKKTDAGDEGGKELKEKAPAKKSQTSKAKAKTDKTTKSKTKEKEKPQAPKKQNAKKQTAKKPNKTSKPKEEKVTENLDLHQVENDLGDFSLDDFNEELKNILIDIDSDK